MTQQVAETGEQVRFRVSYEDNGTFVSGQIVSISDVRAMGRATQRGVIGLIKQIPFFEEVLDEDAFISYNAEIIVSVSKKYFSQLRNYHHAKVSVLSTALLDERILRMTTQRSLPPNFKYVLLHGKLPHDAHFVSDGSCETIGVLHFYDLNDSQKAACRKMVGSQRPIQLLHGPPGTG